MTTTTANAHAAIMERFAGLAKSGKLGHAYLLVGPRAVGKFDTALALARLLICENNRDGKRPRPCEECPACRKALAKTHLDIFVLDAGEEGAIKIAAVREVIQRLQLKAFEAPRKVVIIKDAELMTMESANAFLKTLEEPPQDTVLFLTTSSPELLLSTIKSRCQIVYLFPGARRKVEAALAGEFAVDAPAAQFLSFFSDGSLGRARQLGKEEFFTRKNEVIDQLALSRNNDPYLKEILADKDRSRESLEILLTWFRDLLCLKFNAGPEYLMHADRTKDMEKASAAYTAGQLQEIIAGITAGLKMLDENLNIKIPFYLLMEKIWVK